MLLQGFFFFKFFKKKNHSFQSLKKKSDKISQDRTNALLSGNENVGSLWGNVAAPPHLHSCIVCYVSDMVREQTKVLELAPTGLRRVS